MLGGFVLQRSGAREGRDSIVKCWIIRRIKPELVPDDRPTDAEADMVLRRFIQLRIIQAKFGSGVQCLIGEEAKHLPLKLVAT